MKQEILVEYIDSFYGELEDTLLDYDCCVENTYYGYVCLKENEIPIFYGIIPIRGDELPNYFEEDEPVFDQNHNFIYDEDIIEEAIHRKTVNEIDHLKQRPKLSECSKLLRDIVEAIENSESKMYFLEQDEASEILSNYPSDCLDILESEVKKYNLEDVLEFNTEINLDEGDSLIIGYGDLISRFNDDITLNRIISNDQNKSSDIEI